ncbi:PAS/PAC sensor signal transduction histidine kinase [Deinococcus phoenicis]|uniref:histidine kinase n=1 Tax=Deinococcus phoenicis TaxID=1476583 RepID=A0A016QMN3_9DEIO|nr:PAS domain S-box protein [Deinococcus phoenicis]EYB67122.1 PAS/PAC sensor signal transduction histidine kinase [Deinococcus phoenicis]
MLEQASPPLPDAFAAVDFRPLLAALPDPVLLLDGEAAWLNAAAHECLGDLPAPGAWEALFPPGTARLLTNAAARAGRGETVRESVVLRGSQAPALATLTPAGPGRVLLHLRDTRHPLEVAEELMDGLGLGMLVQAADGRVLAANAAGQDLLGLSLAQMTGQAPADTRWHLVHPDGRPFPPETLPTVHALQTGEAVRDVPLGVVVPEAGEGGADETRWLNVTALPRRAPGAARPKQVTTVFADVTGERRLRQQMQASEERYRSLVEATSQIVWVTTAGGELLGPQPTWAAFTGQSEAGYSGAGWLEAVHPDDRAMTLDAWQQAVESRIPYQVEYRLRRADGVYVPMEARGVAVVNPDGSVREWVGVNQDLSAVKAAEDHLRTLNAELEARVQDRTRELAELTRFSTLLLTAAGEGIFGLDASGRTTFANPAAARILGYSVERLIGSPQHALIHHHHADGRDYPLAECPVHQTLQDGEARRREEDVFWHAQGHPVPVAYVVSPTRDPEGRVTGAVVMFQDVTARVRAQAELESAVAHLERSNRELEQFAYVASHDLQEPLRTVGSYAELLAKRYQGQLDPRADQYLEFMQDAVGRMRSLIQDLLGFARVGRQGTSPQPTPLAEVLRQAAQNVEGTLREVGGTLTWDTPQTVWGHPGLLVQLFTNLIGNGLKFSREGVPPQVRVTARQEGQQVSIEVQDNGIGIAAEYHERVFAIFQRLNRREAYPGNGMGLAICRKIAEQHGGMLSLSSVPGEGTTFHLTLSVQPFPSPQPSPQRPTP